MYVESVDHWQKLALFIVWVPGIELRSSCLVASVLKPAEPSCQPLRLF